MFDTKKQLMWSRLKAGIIVTLAFAALFLAVFFAGTIEKIISPKKITLKVQIEDVQGLRKGAPVWISGVEIGLVHKIELHPELGTIVILAVNKSALTYINKDSQASVLTMGLLGDKYIELSTGSSKAGQIESGDIIKGTTQLKMSEFIAKLDGIITKVESGEGTLGKFIADPSVYDELKKSTKTLSLILGDMKNSRGTMKMLMEDPSLYNRMLAATSSIEEFSRKLNEGNGTIKRLAENPELYENLNKASIHMSSILERIDRGEGVAGGLVRDQELAKELKETIKELKELTKDIKENPKKYFKFSVF